MKSPGLELENEKQFRKISSITKEEMYEIWEIVWGYKFHHNGQIIQFEENDWLPKRFVMLSGVERLGIRVDGKVWADSDLIPHSFYYEKVEQWFIDNNFVVG